MAHVTIAEKVAELEFLRSEPPTPEVLIQIRALEVWIDERRTYNRERLRNWRKNNHPAVRDQQRRKAERERLRKQIERKRAVALHYQDRLKAGGHYDFYAAKILKIKDEIKDLQSQMRFEVSRPGTHTPLPSPSLKKK